ncbi:hypothetical protein CDAR_273561 [Caerostris darwini]|uniref:Uncharacterized protein n=1 Tax=Caerostris darwini TaxID=1538125 RepID=A0AAV4T0J1_9ARAC|nr:hypothetical protein CDAR_273561 [Caerostris darwini]
MKGIYLLPPPRDIPRENGQLSSPSDIRPLEERSDKLMSDDHFPGLRNKPATASVKEPCRNQHINRRNKTYLHKSHLLTKPLGFEVDSFSFVPPSAMCADLFPPARWEPFAKQEEPLTVMQITQLSFLIDSAPAAVEAGAMVPPS